MYVIAEIQGQQFKVEKDRKIFVHRLDKNEGEQVEFTNVLLSDNGSNITVGAPYINGAKITAKVLAHVRGDKVYVFKKKKRKTFKKFRGHRQDFTQVLIEEINGVN